MLDACELALAIPNSDNLDDALRACEKLMLLPRSHQMQQLPDQGAEELLSTELPDPAAEDTH